VQQERGFDDHLALFGIGKTLAPHAVQHEAAQPLPIPAVGTIHSGHTTTETLQTALDWSRARRASRAFARNRASVVCGLYAHTRPSSFRPSARWAAGRRARPATSLC